MDRTEETGITTGNTANPNSANEPKGKGKAADTTPQDVSMDEDDDDDSDEEETGAEDEQQDVQEEEDDDNMEEIDVDNIIGTRTRGKQVDYRKAAEEAKGELGDEDDEDDDDDFEAPDDAMQE